MNAAENFHGHIALPLEEHFEAYLSSKHHWADEAESGDFVAMMSMLLHEKAEPENAAAFDEKCSPYLGKSASEIPYSDAKKLFDEFQLLLSGAEATK